jgi:hypothetical protein
MAPAERPGARVAGASAGTSRRDPAPRSAGAVAHLTIRVRARAGRTGIAGWEGGALGIRVAAPPADGAANEAVRTLLAETLGCARSHVEIVQGHTASTKRVRIQGLSSGTVHASLAVATSHRLHPGPAPAR